MLKKLFYFIIVSFSVNNSFSQILYSERFNALSLNSGTYTANSSTQTYFYSDVPSTMTAINNGTLTADTLTGNYPFRTNGQKQKAWLAYVPANTLDTIAVSTSWLTPTGTANAWLITPIINNIAANTVLTWEAMAPDLNNLDGYEIYVSTNTSTNVVISNFTSLLYSNSGEKNTWQSRGVSLGAYAGQNIRLAFKNNSNNKYQLWLDDIVVQNIANGFDAGAISHDIYKYSTINAINTFSATFKNYGYTPITNLTINYKMDNGVTVSEIKILSPALNYLDTKTLTFTSPYVSATPIYNTYKIWSSNINGQSDQISANDTITGSITISSITPAKKILVEQFTGAGYGWAPDGYTKLNAIVATNTNVIAASIHDNDNMVVTGGAGLISDYATEFPSAMIDRHYFSSNNDVVIEKNNWSSFATERLVMKVPATVTITNVSYNNTTKQIDATVSTTFYGDVKGDYRLNLYVKENNVYGPTNDNTNNNWNQHSFLYNVGSSPYYQMGTYLNSTTYLLSPADYKHQYVVTQMADGAYGASGIIPSNGSTNGVTYTKVYSYTLPTAASGEFRYNADNIYLIGMVSEYDADTKKRSILNVEEVKLTSNPETIVSIKELTSNDIRLTVFPNPTTDVCYLNYTTTSNEFVTVNVFNALGELVYIETKNVNTGNVTHELNLKELNAGNYIVQVSFKNNTVTKKLTIIK